VVVLCLLGFASASGQEPESLQYARQDPNKIEGQEKCGECHVSEFAVWKESAHAKGFREMHKREAARSIAGKLGFALIKRDSLCLKCHFTPQIKRGQLIARAGVSCESCHGEGQDWINIHNSYGAETFQQETPEHREQRISESRRLGMRRPSDLYPVVASCFGCHLVAEEELVNVGGHPSSSGSFEFLEWSQGQNRHNFLQSLRAGDGTQNAKRSPERQRVMYLAGKTVDLEYTLRALAKAEGRGPYQAAFNTRRKKGWAAVKKINGATPLPELDEMGRVIKGIDFNDPASLVAGADSIGELTRRLLGRVDGAKLAALDRLIQGQPEPVAEASTPQIVAEPDAVSAADAETADPTAATPTQRAPVAAAPKYKRTGSSQRKRGAHAAIGPAECLSCHDHSRQQQWIYTDPHYAMERFNLDERKQAQIARQYQIDPGSTLLGSQRCMDCHGTVVTGSEGDEVFEGAACEACHGAAGDFLKPHQEGDPALGEQRPGYVKALTLGMVKMKDIDTRARTCVSCHYIVEQRLISAGHSSGEKFDLIGGMEKIRHWDSQANKATLQASIDRAKAALGTIPTPIALPQPPSTSTASPASSGTTPARFAPTPKSTSTAPQQFRRPQLGGIELAPFPEVEPDASVEELLLLIKQRLEALDRAVRDAAESQR